MTYHRATCIIAVIAAVASPHLSNAQVNVLNTTGNVGIGTNSPATSLHVVGPFTPGLMQVAVRSSGADDRSGISFYNNAGDRSGVMYFGTEDLILGKDGAGRIRFFSAGSERLSIDSSGNVGINWPNPNARLDVQGVGNSALRLFDGPTDTSTIDFQRSADGWKLGQFRIAHAGNYGANLSIKLHPNDGTMSSAPVDVLTVLSNGNVGLGTTAPTAMLHLKNGGQPEITLESSSRKWSLFTNEGWMGGAFGLYNYNTGTTSLYVSSINNVGIGTINPTQKLSVNGTIRAKEVIVETTGWSDYVFASNYTLQPLSEVEAQIKADKHLPGIPSAAEVEAKGVGLGEMQAKLLAKIEELTLYVIDVKKDSEVLKAENAALKTRIRALEAKQ